MDIVLSGFFLPMIVSAAVAFGVVPIVVKHAKKLSIMDDPAHHKHAKVVHSIPVPRGGGIVIMSALLISGLLFLPKDNWLFGILAGAGVLAGIGYLDDRYEEQVSPKLRLFLNALAALCVIGVGIGITFVTNPFGGVIRLDTFRYCFEFAGGSHCINILASAFALVWLVGLQNIVGWSSGVDGQLPGFVVVAAITMAALTSRFLGTGDYSAGFSMTLSGIVAGAYLGFLPWNWWPQKIIPGYGGKSLAGFLLGILAIISSAKVGALVLVLSVPLVDAVMVIFKRLREKRSPLIGGREHLHHYLLDDLGWSKQRIASFYTAVAIIFGFLAYRLQAPAKFFTMAAGGLILGAVILWLQLWSTYSKQPDQDSG